MTTKLLEHWTELAHKLALDPCVAHISNRKMFNNMTWEIPYEDFDGINLTAEQIRYATWKSKFRQLDTNYWAQEEFDTMKEKFLERIKKEQTCLTARFGNKEKRSKSMGFCMQTISMNYIRKANPGHPQFVIELYYRSTEVGQKFLADLKYLSEKVVPYLVEDLPIKPDLIRFRFCTMYLSSMFLPLLFQQINCLKLVKEIIEHDKVWYDKVVAKEVSRWLFDEQPYVWQTHMKQWDNFDINVKPFLTKAEIRSLKRLGAKNCEIIRT